MKRETNYSKYTLVINILILLELSFLLAFVLYSIYQIIELKKWIENSYENFDIDIIIKKLKTIDHENVINSISDLVSSGEDEGEKIKESLQDIFSICKEIDIPEIMDTLINIIDISEDHRNKIQEILEKYKKKK